MEFVYKSDVGKVRSHNEDCVTILKNDHDEYMLIVADGMGGHRKGEVASKMAVNHFEKEFSKLKDLSDEATTVNWLNKNISKINKEIFDYGETHSDSKGLGTTLVLAILTKDYLIFGNIGDSSGYVMKNGKLHKVTIPHTLVNFLVEAGNISKKEAENHPKKNVLLKALGASEECELDIFEVDMDSDIVFLCSDGVTSMLGDEQIEWILKDRELSGVEKVDKLIKKCNAKGGVDNISIAYLKRFGD